MQHFYCWSRSNCLRSIYKITSRGSTSSAVKRRRGNCGRCKHYDNTPIIKGFACLFFSVACPLPWHKLQTTPANHTLNINWGHMIIFYYYLLWIKVNQCAMFRKKSGMETIPIPLVILWSCFWIFLSLRLNKLIFLILFNPFAQTTSWYSFSLLLEGVTP